MKSRPMMAEGLNPQQVRDNQPNPVDMHVGGRIRLRRTLMGMSQEQLGGVLGLTFQQIQKYERGANRVGASRLFDLSRVLDVPISFFYDDMSEPLESLHGIHQTIGTTSDLPETQDVLGLDGNNGQRDLLNRRETLELVRAFYRINEPSVRKRVFELIKSMDPLES